MDSVVLEGLLEKVTCVLRPSKTQRSQSWEDVEPSRYRKQNCKGLEMGPAQLIFGTIRIPVGWSKGESLDTRLERQVEAGLCRTSWLW